MVDGMGLTGAELAQKILEIRPDMPIILCTGFSDKIFPEQALAAGATHLLLDNFTPDALRQAVRLVAGRARLEASGGVEFSTVRQIAETGVHRISVGSLTKDVKAVDLSLRILHPAS